MAIDCPLPGNISGDCTVDLIDVSQLQSQWMSSNCGSCQGSDLTGDSNVDIGDLKLITENWLHTYQPQFTNFVLIIADDMGWNDVGYHGSIIDTPKIDSLAADGIILNRFYTYPICGPSRVALNTGRNPIRLGRTRNIQNGPDGLDVDEYLMSNAFKSAGYQTWCLGKWHLGTVSPFLPRDRGYDHFYGFSSASIDPFTHRTAGVLYWQRNGVSINEEGHSLDLLTKEAIDKIDKRDVNSPFMLYLSYHMGHAPYGADAALVTKYANLGITDPDRQEYAAACEMMDSAIGEVLQKIDDEGLRDNTLVIFISDNGGDTDVGADNSPLRGQKGTEYEGGIRTLSCMRWPGVLPAGETREQAVSIMDIFPTCASALNVTPYNTRPFDGADKWEALRHTHETQHDAYAVQMINKVLIVGDYKLYVPRMGRDNQLYNITTDPNETTDIAAGNTAIVNDMLAKLQLMLDTAP